MHNTPANAPASDVSEIDALRHLADRKRRELLFALYLKHGGDTSAILELLFNEVRPEILERVEAMLGEEGGAS